MKKTCLSWVLPFVGIVAALEIHADEGMWLYNAPPRKMLMERYQFDASDAWLEHLQKSSIRFNAGGSGEFISKNGLVLTNHHVGAGTLQKLSSKEHNLLKTGFHARSLKEELKAPDLELNVLMTIEDVTNRVNEALKEGATAAEAFEQRRAVIAEVEKEAQDRTGLRSNVVTLYRGGLYHLYSFKRYTDVRLVFAPEGQIAAFGGDPDNFEYPRFDLDVCFFRAYENGAPAQIQHFLKWSKDGTKAGELVFVSGNPGHTSRSLTVEELEYHKDTILPKGLARLFRQEVVLSVWSDRLQENARRAGGMLMGIRNGRKALTGCFAGLLEPAILGKKRAEDRQLKEQFTSEAGPTPWERIQEAVQKIGATQKQYDLLEGATAFNSDLFGIARTLVRHAEEQLKPDGERLEEFADSERVSLELGLFSTKPIYKDFEQVRLTDSLTRLAEELRESKELISLTLGGKSPAARAAELIHGTQVEDVAFRRKLYEGGMVAIKAASNDPMIELALAVDATARSLRKVMEEQNEVREQAHALIERTRIAQEGRYPDATFTPRLTFGTVRGYEEMGKQVPAHTTFAGLYERAEQQQHRPPFDLPRSWMDRRSKVDLNTPYNFVSTVDITGGNSGSPVVNRAGEFVGIIFDGNLQSLANDFIYSEEQGRAVSVDSRGILEALRNVYNAGALVTEITGK